jgi:hypothetical protein
VTIDLANLGDPEERNKLAQAVLMADRADGDEPPLTPEAEEHSDPSNDTPPITAPSAAEEHESAARRAEREAALHAVRANQTRIHERNKR